MRPPATQADILAMLSWRPEVRTADVQRWLGISKQAAGMALLRLIRAGSVDRVGPGVYRLAQPKERT